MSGMTLPTVPVLPAGYVVQAADLNNLSYAAWFLANKPYARIQDAVGGVSIPSGPGGPVSLLGVGTVNVAGGVQQDTDGMWNSSFPSMLTVKTPGWYKVRYGITATPASGGASLHTRIVVYTDNTLGTTVANCWAAGRTANSTSNVMLGGGGLVPFYLPAGYVVTLYAHGSSVFTSALSPSPSFLSLEWKSAR